MSARLQKTIFFAFGNALEKPAGTDAKWVKIASVGGPYHRADFAKPITFTQTFFAAMVSNWAAEGKPERPWNYLHRGQSSGPEPLAEKLAAGWIKDLEARPDGLYALTAWTEKARGLILADELRYPSIEFHEDAFDPKLGKRNGPKLFGCALLNDPFLTDLPAVEASANPKESSMLKLAAVALMIGLTESATEEQVNERIKAMKDAEAREAEAAKKLAAADERVKLADQGTGELLKKLSEQMATQAEELKQLRTDRAAEGLIALQSKLQAEGRILAAEKELVATLVSKMGLTEATKFTATWPAKVDLKERGVATKPEGEISPEDAQKQLSAKAEELVKAGVPRERATIRAIELNHDLAVRAQQTSKPAGEAKLS